MRRFRFLPSVNKSYAQQGEIFFCCLRYAQQPRRTREKIRRLCREVAGEQAPALLAYLTTPASWQEVTEKYYLSDRLLQLYRRDFFERWE